MRKVAKKAPSEISWSGKRATGSRKKMARNAANKGKAAD
jgi:hypothetical protein